MFLPIPARAREPRIDITALAIPLLKSVRVAAHDSAIFSVGAGENMSASMSRHGQRVGPYDASSLPPPLAKAKILRQGCPALAHRIEETPIRGEAWRRELDRIKASPLQLREAGLQPFENSAPEQENPGTDPSRPRESVAHHNATGCLGRRQQLTNKGHRAIEMSSDRIVPPLAPTIGATGVQRTDERLIQRQHALEKNDRHPLIGIEHDQRVSIT